MSWMFISLMPTEPSIWPGLTVVLMYSSAVALAVFSIDAPFPWSHGARSVGFVYVVISALVAIRIEVDEHSFLLCMGINWLILTNLTEVILECTRLNTRSGQTLLPF
jgi:hypothetical protein